MAQWSLPLETLQSTVLLTIIPRDYSGIVPSMCIQCLVLVELSADPPASCWVVPFLVTAQKIHCSAYLANYVVGYNTPEPNQVDGLLHTLGDLSLSKCLGEEKQGFKMYLIKHYT